MKGLKTAAIAAGMAWVFMLHPGCFNHGNPAGRLYFEPPAQLIDDYTGMVEVQELNWAWAQPGFKLSDYQGISLPPVSNLTEVEDSTVAKHIHETLSAWFEQNGFTLSESGSISCEGAIVALKTERRFFEKKFIFREKAADFYLEMEFVFKEIPSQKTLCKIRHGVIASRSDQLAGQFLSGLLSYLNTRT